MSTPGVFALSMYLEQTVCSLEGLEEDRMRRIEKRRNLLQLTALLCVIAYQSIFTAAFFRGTGGTVQYLKGALRTGSELLPSQYDASVILGISAGLVIFLEIFLVLYGIRKGIRLTFPVLIAGMMLFYGTMVQVFYEAGTPLILHTVLILVGVCAAVWSWRRAGKGPGKESWKRQWKWILGITLAFSALIVIDRFFPLGMRENGSLAIGIFVFYPGELLKIMLLFFAAGCLYRKAEEKLVRKYYVLSAVSAGVLLLSGDTANAILVLVILVVSSSYLSREKSAVILNVGMAAGGSAAAVFIILKIKTILTGWYAPVWQMFSWENLPLSTVLAGGAEGMGAGGGSGVMISGACSNLSDALSVLMAAYGIHTLILVGVLILGLLIAAFRLAGRRSYLHMLGTLGAAVLSGQYVLHMGADLNILPVQKTTAPLISTDVFGMISAFMMFGMIAAALQRELRVVGVSGKKVSMRGRRIACAAVCTAVVVLAAAGMGKIMKNSRQTAENLGFRIVYAWGNETAESFGQVLDQNGQKLWAWNEPVREDLYSLFGNAADLSPFEETVLSEYEPQLTGSAGYDFRQGADSIKGKGQDVVLTIDPELNRSAYEYLQRSGNTEGSIVLMDIETGAVLAASSWSDSETPELLGGYWSEAADCLQRVSAVFNGGSAREPYLVEAVCQPDGKMIKQYEEKMDKLMEEEEAAELYRIWNDSSADEKSILAESETDQYADGSRRQMAVGCLPDRGLAFYYTGIQV